MPRHSIISRNSYFRYSIFLVDLYKWFDACFAYTEALHYKMTEKKLSSETQKVFLQKKITVFNKAKRLYIKTSGFKCR